MLLLLSLLAAVYFAGSVVVMIGLVRAPLAYENAEGFQLGHSPDEDLPATFSWWSDDAGDMGVAMAKDASLQPALDPAAV